MAVEVVMPRMGQSMEEGRIVRWLKPVGASVQRGEVLVEIETDKANIEVEAGASGYLATILAAEDAVVAVGTAIALIEESQAAAAANSDAPSAPSIELTTPAADRLAASQSAAPMAPSPPAAPAVRNKPARVPASPLARRLAAEHGLDLHTVTGTGPGGRVGKADVLARVAARTSGTRPSPNLQRVSLSKMRRTIGQRMVTSKTTIPHFYLSIDLDMRQALALRDSLSARRRPVSLTAILLKAVALAIAEHPQLNATLEGDAIAYADQVDLAVAVALPDGLITPVVHGCQALSLEELGQATQAVIERARSGRLHPGDLETGTFTVSNLGMFGIKHFEAIINPPQAAVLALGAIQRVPVFDVHDNVVAAQLLTATLSVDHRVVDGAEAARYLGTLKQLLADGFALV
jgi:pyruvate dehydrogenase E2 component (dihydrolipoamide acetyltransferase)